MRHVELMNGQRGNDEQGYDERTSNEKKRQRIAVALREHDYHMAMDTEPENDPIENRHRTSMYDPLEQHSERQTNGCVDDADDLAVGCDEIRTTIT